jgi:hypothetical protein
MSSPLSLTAIGTVRGRVSRRELCLSEIQRELTELLLEGRFLDGAPFGSVSIVVHLGEEKVAPRVWGIHRPSSELEIAVGVPMTAVRRKKTPQICGVMRQAAVDALIVGLGQHGIPTDAFVTPRSEAVDH